MLSYHSSKDFLGFGILLLYIAAQSRLEKKARTIGVSSGLRAKILLEYQIQFTSHSLLVAWIMICDNWINPYMAGRSGYLGLDNYVPPERARVETRNSDICFYTSDQNATILPHVAIAD